MATINGHEYVDLGLPSGTLWATCNVGANTPEGYGDYFAWGEIDSKTTYNWRIYKYCKGRLDKMTRYCSDPDYGNNGFTDKLIILHSADDPATVNWGSGWRTSTLEEWEELLNNTSNEWTIQNGVKGRLFVSKKNGQTIFLPAAGLRVDLELGDVGLRGGFWSSLLNIYHPYDAWYFYFGSDECGMGDLPRDAGRSVRAVHSSCQN